VCVTLKNTSNRKLFAIWIILGQHKKNYRQKMYNLPPLNALRAFEAAARSGSFVQAGQELGVSSAAISLQVKSLEQHLGKNLFFRKGNRIFLTDSGEAIYPKAAKAFGHLSDISLLVQNHSARPQLSISVLPALSELWLLPKAIQFRQEFGISLALSVDNDPIDFIQNGTDLRITYGSAYYEGYRTLPLFTDVAIPVCASSFWQRHWDAEGNLSNVPDSLLIHNAWGRNYSTEPSWAQWMKANSGKVSSINKELVISDISLAIAAARNGTGIALVPKSLAADDLRKGALIAPCSTELKMKKAYVCIFANARSQYLILQQFLEFLGTI
jgi:LysR family glycine cleavage system transcriptional activator